MPEDFQHDLEIRVTGDGSHTLYSKRFDSPYHSMKGAIRESLHVFIETGLAYYCRNFFPEKLHVLETGLGTGLNALLALLFAREIKTPIQYDSLEKHPVGLQIASQLNYTEKLGAETSREAFLAMHRSKSNEITALDSFFTFTWFKEDFESFDYPKEKYHVLFFDPFDANTHQAVWEQAYLEKLYNALKPEGILVTYGAKGSFKRALKALGMYVEALQGPPGKREITRAIKG